MSRQQSLSSESIVIFIVFDCLIEVVSVDDEFAGEGGGWEIGSSGAGCGAVRGGVADVERGFAADVERGFTTDVHAALAAEVNAAAAWAGVVVCREA